MSIDYENNQKKLNDILPQQLINIVAFKIDPKHAKWEDIVSLVSLLTFLLFTVYFKYDWCDGQSSAPTNCISSPQGHCSNPLWSVCEHFWSRLPKYGGLIPQLVLRHGLGIHRK